MHLNALAVHPRHNHRVHDADQGDAERHRQSVLHYLHQAGYDQGRYLPRDLRALVRSAGLEEVTMTATVDTKTRHNGHRAPPGGPIQLVPVDAPPPAHPHGGGRWQALLPQLQAQPGQWFDAGIHPRGSCDHLRQHGVEVVKRGVGDPAQARVFLRWPG